MASAVRTFAHLAGVAAGRAAAVAAGIALTAGVSWGAQDIVLSAPAEPPLLVIEGSISGVRAGAPAAPLRLTLRNPGTVARDVRRVDVAVTGVRNGPAACGSRDYLTAGSWTGAVAVPARGTATVTVGVAVSAALPAACLDVTWRLSYTAS